MVKRIWSSANIEIMRKNRRERLVPRQQPDPPNMALSKLLVNNMNQNHISRFCHKLEQQPLS